MSVHLIYYEGAKKKMRPIQSREEYMKLRHSTRQQKILKAVHSGDEELKRKLVQMNYSCLPNDDSSLKGSTRMSTTVGMDIDHVGADEMESLKEHILSKKDELGLLMLEVSARGEGYHLVFRRREELTQEENLKWASDLLGVKYDEGAKDITRVFYTTTGEELLFLDDEIFQAQASPQPSPNGKGEENNKAKASPQPSPKGKGEVFPDNYHGIPFKDIIAKYWEVNNRGFEPTQGDRDTLTYQLACDLRHICGRNFEWLDQVIPCYDGFPTEEKREKIKSALSSEFNGFPSRLRNTLNALASTDSSKRSGEDDEEEEKLSTLNSKLSTLNSLPPIFKEFTDAAPEDFKVPTVMALLPVMGTLMSGLRAEYLDGEEHAPNFITVVEAPQASGKSFTRKLVDECMKSVREYDVQERAKEKEYNDALKRAKNAKEQPQDPKALIRMVPASISIAKLLKRLACSGGLHLFTFLEELDTLTKSNRAGAWSQKSDIYRNAFDNAMYGQDFMSDNSYSDIVPVFYNMLLCGTPNAVGRFFNDPEDGLVSRVMFVQLPDQFGAEIPRWKKVPAAQLQKIERLCREMDKSLCVSEEGKRQEPKEIDLGYVNAPLKRWLEEQRMESLKNVDYARDTFRRRSAVMGFRAAMIAHWLWGEPKDKKRRERVIHFALFVADYVLRQQIVKYGNRLEEIRNKQITGGTGRTKSSKTLYEELKDVFSRSELQEVMRKYEFATPLRVMLSIWKKNGFIEPVKGTSNDKFKKLQGC